MVSSCMLVGGCRVRFLMRRPCCTFGQAKLSADDVWEAARSFCLLRLSFTASCLSASNLRLAFLTDDRELSPSAAVCCHDCWLIPACASCLSSWSLLRFHGAPKSRFSSRSSIKKTALGMRVSSIIVAWPVQRSCTSVFFRQMLRTKFLAGSEKRLTMYCRASSV